MEARDWDLLMRLQAGLPLCPRPYQEVGRACGLEESEVIARVRRFREEGLIRRWGARIGHLQAGIRGNVMVAWQVPEHRVEEVGSAFAQHSAVSHCYERQAPPEFPFNLYTMVHAPDLAVAQEIVEGLSRMVGVSAYEMLPTLSELKKASPRFSPPAGDGR